MPASMSIVVAALLSLQFSSFTLMRARIRDSTCTSCVLLWSEVMKAALSTCAAGTDARLVFRDPWPIAIPAACFIVMNIVSFWCVARVSASLYIMMMQLKLPWTLFTSWLVLERRFTAAQVIAVFLIAIACANILMHESQITLGGEYWPIVGMVVETLLSALCSVYMQKVFANSFTSMWVRNAELALLSIPVYAAIVQYRQCEWIPTQTGTAFALLASAGGILVALSLLYCGAMAKNIVTSSSIAMVTVADYMFDHRVPSFSHASFYVVCMLSIVLYSVTSVPVATTRAEEYSEMLLRK